MSFYDIQEAMKKMIKLENDIEYCIVIEHEWASTRFEENYDHPPTCVGDWSRPMASGLPCSGNGCSWTYECFNGVIEIEDEL